MKSRASIKAEATSPSSVVPVRATRRLSCPCAGASASDAQPTMLGPNPLPRIWMKMLAVLVA